MLSQLDVREEADMTPINLDSVLQAGLSASSQSQSRAVEGEKLADARAQVLQGTVSKQSNLLEPDTDKFSFGRDSADDTDDARLNRALRSLAEKFQAGQAAQAAVADAPAPTKVPGAIDGGGQKLAFVGSF